MAKREKVFVAMSGGVDSSVAALLLNKKGYELVGCFIKGWYPSGFSCDWKRDRRDAMRVCAKLGIPFITVDAEKEYKRDVVDYMIREYKAGRTPNPDVMCNRSVKFGVFLKKALEMGADKIATGHYVRLRQIVSRDSVFSARSASPAARFAVLADSLRLSGDHAESAAEAAKTESRLLQAHMKKLTADASESKIFSLLQAKDKNKDQSYFLWALTQEQLKYCMFPVGNLLKPEVKKIARDAGFDTAEKDESMGVCFIGEFNMIDFLKKYIKPKKGKVVTPDGKVVGEHEGAIFYTLGQRRGFGGGGGIPYYIVEKNIKKNILIVADKAREEEFSKREVEIESVNWIGGEPPKHIGAAPSGLSKNSISKLCKARIRYRQPLQSCRVENLKPKIKNSKKYKVIFCRPQRAVTPGQSLVIYTGQTMLGGGVIA